MKQYYFDNAATSSPKAPGVGERMAEYIQQGCTNVNRGVYSRAAEAELAVMETRELLCSLFGFSGKPNQAVFTPGATWGLNMLIKGYLHPGDHVIVSSMEHNAVMRPLTELLALGVEFSRIPAGEDGCTDPGDIAPLIRENTKLMLVSHASNVSGTIFPLKEAARICRSYGIPLAVDAAQTAGHMALDFDELGLSALCVPGHKGLCGPQGIGAVLLEREFADRLSPLITGGTGSASDSELQPGRLPDKFESGTLNLPGILGLNTALSWFMGQDMAEIRERERALTERFIEGVKGAHIRIAGPADASKQVGVVSLDFLGIDNAEAAFCLERDYNILTRCGLHCAPNAHKTLCTFPRGTVRFSFGQDTSMEDIDYAARAVCKIASQK